MTSFQIFSSRLDDQVTKELLGIFPFSVLQDFTTIDLIKGEKPKGQNGSRNFTFGLVNLIRNFLLQIFFIGWSPRGIKDSVQGILKKGRKEGSRCTKKIKIGK